MFKGFQQVDGFRNNLFNAIPQGLTDKRGMVEQPYFWLDANEASKITLSGNKVISIADKGNSGIVFSQSLEAYRPTLVSNYVNGKAAINFNGSFLAGSITSSFKEVLCVFNNTSESITSQGLFTTTVGSSDYILTVMESTNTFNSYYSIFTKMLINKVATRVIPTPVSTFKVVDTYSVGEQITPSTFHLGKQGNLGYTFFWLGYVTELLTFKNILSDTDRKYWNDYLIAKYNIAI